jgi:hypothetical protein
MWPPSFKSCFDLAPADCLRPRLLPWGTGTGTPVTSIVPVGYDAYVRVFHPVGAPAPAEFVTWQEVADWSGRVFHPLAQFEKMSMPVRPNPGPPPFVEPPLTGTLIPVLCDVLVRRLTRLTRTPSTCYFALWEGWGQLSGSQTRFVGATVDDPIRDAEEYMVAAWRRQVARLPRLEHLHRRYVLGHGSIGAVCDLYRQPLGHDPRRTLGLTPQIWWPEDRAWVVGSEIDFDSTIVATTNVGADALLNCEGLEALLVPSDGRLDLDGGRGQRTGLTDDCGRG